MTQPRLSIGDFSRMTYLSVKALRRYHDMGLLVPAVVDSYSRFRYYEPEQVPVGQVIRRFRDLGMPLEQVKEVLQAPDATARNELIVAHLQQMEHALEQTRQTVASLRALLERPVQAPIAVEYRSVPTTRAVTISEPVAMADFEYWWSGAFAELHNALASASAPRTGPDAALFPNEFFEAERGEVVAFIPVAETALALGGRARLAEIPAAELAVTVYQGNATDIDQAYGALGTFVAEREIGVQGPIREYYVADSGDESEHRTEVCWPVFLTRGDMA
jgi:DNA-binding transcriptional MerR regulator